MFLWSDQLGNFLYHFLGAFKQLCRKIFLLIAELWILEKFKDFNPLSRGCSSGRISLAIFYIISRVHSSNCAVKFFFGNRRTLNFGEIQRFQPSLQGMFLWSDQLGSFFISFPGCIQAIVPKNFFGIRLTMNFGEIKRFQPPLQGMFLWSDKLGNFSYHFLGALKQFCSKIFLVIDELWILE